MQPLVVILPGVRLNDLVFSSASEIITVGYVDRISRWDVHTGQEISRIVDGHAEAVAISVDINSDGSRVGTGGGAWNYGVRLWNTTTGAVQELGRHEGIVVGIAFNPSGTQLASGDSHNQVQIWDVAQGLPVTTFEGDVPRYHQSFANLHWLDDHTIVAAGPDVTYWWDVTTGQLQERLARPEEAPFFVDVAIGQDSNQLAAVAQNDAVHVWNRATVTWTAWAAWPDDQLGEAAFSPDEQLLAAGTFEGKLLLWNVNTQQLLVECPGPADSIVEVEFSPDGRYIAAIGWDSTIWLWGVPFACHIYLPIVTR